MRKAIVAGSFYPADKDKLREDIRNFLNDAKGIKKPERDKIYGVVSPHAGYICSGQCAAYSYSEIIESGRVETFIILGTNHTGYVESDFALSGEDFETPLGIAKNDKEFYDLLISKGKGVCGDSARDKIAHQNEHSIEVQLPFLQFLFGNKFKIVPIICKTTNLEKDVNFAKLIIETAKKLKRKTFIIASGDFTHYGFSYGFVPFSTNIKENLYSLDKGAIDLIIKLRTRELLAYSSKTTICGAGAIALAIETCKLLGSKKAELLKYCTSGEITGDYSNAVGYSSIVFE